ncbi:MAG TPA: biotin--[acetyl-CoA-carboxylase] ligase, partial [Bacteroidales bacterium]|nr:biotin--[acetyl-CoA-carboxylase] ligase [Bacteroidales bacterium]
MEIYNNILIFDTLESTNAHAFKIIEQQQTIEDFTVIVTQNQTAGKGQRGNTWLSEPQKNCLFSIILNPVHIPANNQFILSQTIS